MKTKITYIDRNDFVRPVGPQATQALLDQQTIPALAEHEYQEWAEYLASAPRPLRVQVAETLFRHNRQHPHALALFLACAYQSAQQIAARVFEKNFSPRLPDLTQDLLYDGAIDGAIRMFQPDQDVTDFQPAFHLALKGGAIRGAFGNEIKKALVKTSGLRDRLRGSRIEDQLIAKDILEQITHLEPEPQTACLRKFLQCIIEIGPHDVLKAWRWRRGTTLEVDFQPVMEKLEIRRSTAKHYLSRARKMLKAKFDPDGTFFIEHSERKPKR